MFGFFVFASGGLPGLSGFVGEFLALVGTFEVSPLAAAIAAFVMVLAAGYLLYMYGRIVFGEVSEFLASLGDHLADMTPIETLTLVPLATLIVVFGLQPGLLLDLIGGTVREHAGVPRRPVRRCRSGRRSCWSASGIVVLAVDRRGSRSRLRPGRSEPAGHRGRRRRGGPLSAGDFVTISPLIAAVLTAAAVLIVDLIRPGRHRPGDRRPRSSASA